MRPVIKRWKIWLITLVGGYLGSSAQIQPGYGLSNDGSLVGAIEGAILLDLGYLFIALLISMFFEFRTRNSGNEVD